MRGGAAAVLLLASACSEDSELALMPPVRPTAKAMILAIGPVESQGSVERVIAVSLGTAVQPIRFESSKSARITALLYDRTLAELLIPEGELTRATPGTPSIAVPEGDGAFILDIPESNSWSATQARTIDFKIASATPCPVFVTTAVPIDSAVGQPKSAVAIDDESALVFFNDGGWWRVDKSGATRLFDRERVYAAWRSETGDLWIVTSTGTLLRGDLERGFTQTATIPVAIQTAAIDGSRFPANLELFIMIDEDQLVRFDGRDAKVVDVRHESADSEVDVAWVGPNVAVAIGQLGRAIVRYDAGNTFAEEFQPAFNYESPTAILHDPVLGSFIGSANGFMYRKTADDAGWEVLGALGDETFGARVEQLTPWRDGVAIGVGRSQISFFFENFPACPLQQYGDRHFKALLNVGGDLLVVPDQRSEDIPPYSMLWLSAAP